MLDKPLLNRLYRYCAALTDQNDDAWDLLQTAVEKYLRAHPADIRNQYAYLIRIIRHQHIDDIRKMSNIDIESFDETLHTDTELDALEQTMINRDEIELFWRLLTLAEREVIFLWAVEGFSAREIALHLDISRGTVLSRLFRARKKIVSYQQNMELSAGL